MKTKTQKGITLIALIITIIVMLILVGVSVSVALNTGLFKTAQDAGKNTQVASEEELQRSNGMIKIEGVTTDVSLQGYVDSLNGGNGGAGERTGEHLGKYVQYDNKLWVVLYDDNTNGLQMVTANVLEAKNVYLGYKDPTIVNAVNETEQNKDLNGDGKVENIRVHTTEGTVSNIEKAIYSYNNAIETLNKKCEGLVTDKSKIETVRSVGNSPNNKNSENSTPYTSANLAKVPKNNANYTAGIFNGKGKSEDSNYESDYTRMLDLGINVAQSVSGVKSVYWLASRRVIVYSSYVNFLVRFVHTDGDWDSTGLWYVDSSNADDNGNPCYGVRPVVTLKSGIQLVGEGTEANPCTLQ